MVQTCKAVVPFSSVLMTSGVYEYEPRHEVFICHANVGRWVRENYKTFSGMTGRNHTLEGTDIKPIEGELTEKLYPVKGPINTMLIPIMNEKKKCGVLVGKIKVGDEKLQDIRCGREISTERRNQPIYFSGRVCAYLFGAPKKAIIHTRKYMEVRKSSMKNDNFSSEAYVLSTIAMYAKNRRSMRKETLVKYDTKLMERYRWCAREGFDSKV